MTPRIYDYTGLTPRQLKAKRILLESRSRKLNRELRAVLSQVQVILQRRRELDLQAMAINVAQGKG
jgi:hypothetical protein